MRVAVAEYVAGLHQAYVRSVRTLSPAAQGRMPLIVAGEFTVAAVGTRFLHLVATHEALGEGARGRIAAVEGEAEGLRWRLRFYDASVLPALSLVDERDGPTPAAIRDVIGLRTHLYHLTLRPPAELGAHHAGHSGAALAGSHAAAAREFETIRRSIPAAQTAVAAEFEGAVLAGLPIAAGLLARALAPDDAAVTALGAQGADAQLDGLRSAVLAAVRGQTAAGLRR